MQDAVFHLMKPHGELLFVAIPDLQENSGSASIRTRLSTMCALKPMPKQDARFFGDALAGSKETEGGARIRLPSSRGARLCALDRESAACVMSLPMPSSLRSEEHTSELQSLMRISYAVFCLKQKQ